MKHLLILLFITLSFNTMAQKYALNSHRFVMIDETGIIANDASDIDMVLDLDKSRLVIYSKETQVIDYEPIRRYVDEDNYAVTESIATDTNWKDIRLNFLINTKNGNFIVRIVYPSYEYAYICKIL